jgi:hypothetical protein
LIEEGAHLTGHIAETGWGTKDDGIILCQLLRRGDGRVLRFPPALANASACMVSGTRFTTTSTPSTRFAPSATA